MVYCYKTKDKYHLNNICAIHPSENTKIISEQEGKKQRWWMTSGDVVFQTQWYRCVCKLTVSVTPCKDLLRLKHDRVVALGKKEVAIKNHPWPRSYWHLLCVGKDKFV